jgi:hypothetical protein
MFTLNVTNNYFQEVGGYFVPPPQSGYRLWQAAPNGGKVTVPDLGNFQLQVPNMGSILFIDLGNTKLPQYTNPKIPWTESTWGGLIRYRGLDAYFRYEGGGIVNLVIDAYGSINVSFPQGGMLVSLDDFTVS